MRQSVQRYFLTAAVLFAWWSAPALAQADRYPLCPAGHTGRCVGLDGAVRGVRRKTGDRVLSADTVRVKGRDLHRIKVITRDGRVRQLYVDVKTGRLLRPRR